MRTLPYSDYCAGQDDARQCPNELVEALCGAIQVGHYSLHTTLLEQNPSVLLDEDEHPRLHMDDIVALFS